MLFVEAINKSIPQPKEKTQFGKAKYRPIANNRDSVDLSSTANQVKEIHIDGTEKSPLTASASVFANLVEHALSYITDSKQHIHSPEELSLAEKKWMLFLQVPPAHKIGTKRATNYGEPKIHSQPPVKPLIFYIPVKPSYGPAVEMTLLLSPHHGSPEKLSFFRTLPKESRLPTLNTPYTPEFLSQQVNHYHILLDQDGEADQLTSLYAHINQSKVIQTQESDNLSGLRVWRLKNNIPTPVVLGDKEIGLVFIAHYKPLNSHTLNNDQRTSKTGNLYTQA